MSNDSPDWFKGTMGYFQKEFRETTRNDLRMTRQMKAVPFPENTLPEFSKPEPKYYKESPDKCLVYVRY